MFLLVTEFGESFSKKELNDGDCHMSNMAAIDIFDVSDSNNILRFNNDEEWEPVDKA